MIFCILSHYRTEYLNLTLFYFFSSRLVQNFRWIVKITIKATNLARKQRFTSRKMLSKDLLSWVFNKSGTGVKQKLNYSYLNLTAMTFLLWLWLIKTTVAYELYKSLYLVRETLLGREMGRGMYVPSLNSSVVSQ